MYSFIYLCCICVVHFGESLQKLHKCHLYNGGGSVHNAAAAADGDDDDDDDHGHNNHSRDDYVDDYDDNDDVACHLVAWVDMFSSCYEDTHFDFVL